MVDPLVTKISISSSVSSYVILNLSPGATYFFRLTVYNSGGSQSNFSNEASTPLAVPAVDNQPPSVPSNPACVAVSSTQISFSWTAATDNVFVTGYVIFRNNIPIATTGTVSYLDQGLLPSTIYTYAVSAFDAAGNNSAVSASTSTVTRPASFSDTVPPTISLTAPADLATISGPAVPVSATALDNVSVAGVQFKLDGSNIGAEITALPYSISWNTTLVPNGNHILTAVARDTFGNQATSTITVTINNNFSTPPPSPPGGYAVFVYPNPARDPVVRAFIGAVDEMQVSIYNILGMLVHKATVRGSPTGISGGQYFYEYRWTGSKASGVYIAVVHANAPDRVSIDVKSKFVVLR